MGSPHKVSMIEEMYRNRSGAECRPEERAILARSVEHWPSAFKSELLCGAENIELASPFRVRLYRRVAKVRGTSIEGRVEATGLLAPP